MKRVSHLIVILFLVTGASLFAQQPSETQIFDEFLEGASHVVTGALSFSEAVPPTVQVEPLIVNGYPGFYGAYTARRFEEVLLSLREASGLRILDGGAADFRIQLSGSLFSSEVSLMIRLVESDSSAVIALKEFTYPRSEVWEQMLLTDSAGGSPLLVPDSCEPNDSCAQAREIDLEHYRNLGLTLTSENPDFFKFNVSEEQVESAIEIVLETHSDMDTKLALYHESDPYTSLLEDDDSGPGNNGSLSFSPARPGLHYLKVVGYDSGTEGPYTLSLELRTPPRDEFEPDGDWDLGAELPLDESVQNHLFSSSEDVDWVVLHVPEDTDGMQILTVQTLGFQDTVLALYDQDHQQINSNDDSGEQGRNARIVQPVPAGGTYYLEVRAYSLESGNRGEYGLTGKLTTMTADAFEDIDNEADTAPFILPGERSTGRRLSYERDFDWFRFTLDEPGLVTIQTLGDSDTRIGLFKSADCEDLLGEDDDSGEGYNACVKTYLPAGTFYGIVCPNESYTYGEEYSYDLIMEVSQP